MEELKVLKKKARSLNPIIRIGKSGITDNIISEIKKQLKLRHLIKVKFLKSFVDSSDKHEAVEKIVTDTTAKLIERKGNTLVIYK